MILPVMVLMPLALAGPPQPGPYASQAAAHVAKLAATDATVRAGAAEALGFLRSYAAENALLAGLADAVPEVRREAALALAWCGGRQAVRPLIDALNDPDWHTSQNAAVALTNLTGMPFPFDALAAPVVRQRQADRWRSWWETVPADRPPPEVLALLDDPNLARGRPVRASEVYRGPAAVLTDGRLGPEYWQTKDTRFPQSCTVDLGRPVRIDRVVVHQHSEPFVMTDYALDTSLDGKSWEPVERREGRTAVVLAIAFAPREARYVRIAAFGSANRRYPATFFEVEVFGGVAAESPGWRQERGLRALGALGGRGAAAAVYAHLQSLYGRTDAGAPASRPIVEAAFRALGRLKEPATFPPLVHWLGDVAWARHAANALGEFGDRRAVPALVGAYPYFARGLKDELPRKLPADDDEKFPNEDRAYETPFAITAALARLPLDDPGDQAGLRAITPLLLANLPGDHDAAFLYEREGIQELTAWLLDAAAVRDEAVEGVFMALGQPRRGPARAGAPALPSFEPYRMAAWLPALCRDRADVPRLVALLEHPEGWVRLNAAKTLAFLGDRRAIEPMAQLLTNAKPEADFGYSGVFNDEEYNDPAPRWREGLVRALGRLGAAASTKDLERILYDERSVLEVRHAAAQALAELRTAEALAVLARAADNHPFYRVRLTAQEAVWRRQRESSHAGKGSKAAPGGAPVAPAPASSGAMPPAARVAVLDRIVFLKGANQIPNTEGTVEQADRWYQTYVVTDHGPAYRPARNIFSLAPPRPDGTVMPITRFADGYVAELEVSYDGRSILFSRRGQDDPWWHLCEIGVDGTDLRQLTDGPYHDVGANYLPDGRIVFASSRLGVRDEYHGYPATGLYVMNADGSGMRPIAVNIGRDNEPAVLPDGRIVFSRLEVFYSRLKTELTVHAVRPDGAQDMVLYGPERRQFWRDLRDGPRTPAHDQEAPLTHRVLRMSQPQALADGRILCVTQAGLAILGPQRNTEQIIPHDPLRAFTTPYPLPDGRILCAATKRAIEKNDVDVGLYLVEPATGALTLVYNDPATADFEPRPVLPRPRPPVLPETIQPDAFTGRLACASVFHTQEPAVKERGRLLRVVEGTPVVSRHSTQTNPWPVWKNHHGTLARVLGTVPLAADGSFHVELPADRLVHLQVLDSDRRVVGNQLTWIYVRPGETKACVGCHQSPHQTSAAGTFQALGRPAARCLPTGDELLYRAKAWFKGHLPDAVELRTRTVRAVNLLAQ